MVIRPCMIMTTPSPPPEGTDRLAYLLTITQLLRCQCSRGHSLLVLLLLLLLLLQILLLLMLLQILLLLMRARQPIHCGLQQGLRHLLRALVVWKQLLMRPVLLLLLLLLR